MRLQILALVALFAAIPSHADTVLTPVTASVELDFPDSSTFYNGASSSLQSYSVTEATGTVSASNQLGSDPLVTGAISASSLPSHASSFVPIDFDSESYLYYEFAVDGPANQTVAVNFSSVGTAAVSALNTPYSLNASAFLSISGTNVNLTEAACAGSPSQVSDPCGSQSGPASNNFNFSQTLEVQTDTPYLVNIYTSDSILTPVSGATGNFSASSSVDPTISLDTSDPAYSLEFSPGLLGASPTPEPGSLLLVATGLAGAFGLHRRKAAAPRFTRKATPLV